MPVTPPLRARFAPTTATVTRVAPLVLAAWLALVPAHAQQPAPAPIEQQMSAEQFRAAGLDRLDPAQLANLNAWLNRAIATETTKAAATAQQKVKDDSRGFFNFGTTEPIIGRISGPFRGFDKGRSYTLENGQVWQQVDTATLAGVRLDQPQVRITPGLVGNVWYMAVAGYSTRAKVQRIK